MDGRKEYFYRIVMNTLSGKKLYLKAGKCIGDKMNCEWEFTNENAIWFDTHKEAENFAKDYFKNFKEYKIEEFSYII